MSKKLAAKYLAISLLRQWVIIMECENLILFQIGPISSFSIRCKLPWLLKRHDLIVPGTLQPGGDSWKLPVVKVYSPTASPASTSFRRCFSEDVPPSSRCSSTRTLPPDNDDFDKTTKEGASRKGTSAKTHVQTSLGNFER